MNRQQEYEQYIKSDVWKQKRQQRLKIDAHECQTCCSTERLEVHHKHYRNFKNEQMADLITLCHDCHEAITNVFRSRKYEFFVMPETDYKDIRPERITLDDSGNQGTVNRGSTIDYAQWANSESIKQLRPRT